MERNPNLNLKIILTDIFPYEELYASRQKPNELDRTNCVQVGIPFSLLSHIPTPVVVDPISTIPVFIFHLTISNSPHLTFNTTESLVTFNL